MNKLKRLETYLATMKHRLEKEVNASDAKRAWLRLEIRRTEIDINNLRMGG